MASLRGLSPQHRRGPSLEDGGGGLGTLFSHRPPTVPSHLAHTFEPVLTCGAVGTKLSLPRSVPREACAGHVVKINNLESRILSPETFEREIFLRSLPSNTSSCLVVLSLSHCESV